MGLRRGRLGCWGEELFFLRNLCYKVDGLSTCTNNNLDHLSH